MDIQFYGANCISITTRKARVLIDDNLTDLGSKSVAKEGDIALFTGSHATPVKPAKIIIDQPGEYEVTDISIYGIAVRSHIDETNQKSATMYKLIFDDTKVLITGHIYPELNDKQLEAIGTIDVMIVPVGGHGFTLDGVGALTLVKKVEPKLVIPTHYDDNTLQFVVPQASLEDALKELAMETKETTSKLKVKQAELTDVTQLVIIEKS